MPRRAQCPSGGVLTKAPVLQAGVLTHSPGGGAAEGYLSYPSPSQSDSLKRRCFLKRYRSKTFRKLGRQLRPKGQWERTASYRASVGGEPCKSRPEHFKWGAPTSPVFSVFIHLIFHAHLLRPFPQHPMQLHTNYLTVVRLSAEKASTE